MSQTASVSARWLDRLEREHRKAIEALEAIQCEGKVCDAYEVCDHRACQSSYAAWAIADAYLRRGQS